MGQTIFFFSLAWCAFFLSLKSFKRRGKGVTPPWKLSRAEVKGVFYNFTFLMSPFFKESARLYPKKFILGLGMHGGVVLALLLPLLWPLFEEGWMNSLAAMATLTAAHFAMALLFFRIRDRELRAISIFDDYASLLLTMFLLGSATLHLVLKTAATNDILLMSASLIFFAMPFGKLKHALFFFLVRYDYGTLLGKRGVFKNE
ncbi:MAG: hypothetical protein HQK50_09195 [Oligoflexia bacterium]|nr:hypothetical protein [Oligoflexia bacterium]MBF0365735.1 hypothetical protein [Oligoflexia bacterium]